MKITIVGHGNVGGTLATTWASNHEVIIGARNLESEGLTKLKKNPGLKFCSIPEAVSEGEVILVAIPADLTKELAETIGDVSGKVIIDSTNAIQSKPDPYPTAPAVQLHW